VTTSSEIVADVGRWLRSRAGRIAILAVIGAAIVVAFGVTTYRKLYRETPPPYIASDEDHFLFGSVGTEREQGVPYWIWLVLPRIFPEHLARPGGYAALGLLAKDGHEMPIGLSRATIGVSRVGPNCAMCHTASVRLRAGAPPRIYPAAPAQQTAVQQYRRFLADCAADPRFTADTILGEIAKNTRLSLLDRVIYRVAIIPSTRRALLRLKQQDGWMLHRPDWGRGRVDRFNEAKFALLQQPIDQTIGTADAMPVWNLARHEGFAYQWDGLNTSLDEVIRSSALDGGATRDWLERDLSRWDNTAPAEMSSLRRIRNYLSALPPPPYPFPIDATLARTGEQTYRAHCASCHGIGGTRAGSVVPVQVVGTDAHRAAAWTPAAAAAYNAYGDGQRIKFERFRSTNSYVAVPLDGVWLRAPYLHNGSVPTLRDLLEPPANRPAQFWRGADLYDPAGVGFVSSGPDAEWHGARFDTRLPGNGNGGHTYGTDLSASEKTALIEFLKTQ
jgi:mono/diheme cytochrome c family protein